MSDTPHDTGGEATSATASEVGPLPDGRAIRRFVLPSLLGILTFLTPLQVDGNWTILMGFLAAETTSALRPVMPWAVLALLWISAAGTVITKLRGRAGARYGVLTARLFDVAGGWVVLRIIGVIMGTMTVFQLGPEVFWGANTGGTVLNDLAVNILLLFLYAGFLMPFLTDYGLMEFIGTMLKRVFRRLFTLPGRSAIDALASWLSSAPVGVLITIQQYVSGHYSSRESAVIATNFSVVSVPFALLVAQTVRVDHIFLSYYGAVALTGIVLAMIMPRIPPLSRFQDTPFDEFNAAREADTGDGSLLREALVLAAERARIAPPLGQQMKGAVGNIFDIWFGLVPAVIAVGGFGMILAEHTEILQWLTAPLVPVLELFRLPEAAAAAPALVAGFLDMFLPALLASNMDAEITRFVVGVLSVTQLIYMSEVGILMMKCEIPLRFHHLLVVFLLRTLIALPIVLAYAHFLVY